MRRSEADDFAKKIPKVGLMLGLGLGLGLGLELGFRSLAVESAHYSATQ